MSCEVFNKNFSSLKQEILYRTGLDLFNKGSIEDSIPWFQEITLIKGEYTEFLPAAYIQLGDIFEIKRSGSGKPYYQKVISILGQRKKKNHLEIYRLGSLYKRLGNHQEAYRWFGKLIKQFPLYTMLAGAHFHLGELYLLDKDFTNARKMFKRCISVLPEHIKAREYLDTLNKEKN